MDSIFRIMRDSPQYICQKDENMKNKVVIMRGLPGSGKSRYASKLVSDSPGAVICSADHFFEREDSIAGISKEYRFDPFKLPEAHAQCFRNFLRALRNKCPLVIVDNTNIRCWEFQNYMAAAWLADYEIDVVEFRAETIEDVRVCANRNTHKVPPDIVAKMAMEFEQYDGAIVAKIER